jgi:transcription-repair coupling factor (superfamily II helicase)
LDPISGGDSGRKRKKMLSHIVEKIRQSRSVESILGALKSAEGPVRVSGLLGSSRSVLTSVLHSELGPTTAVICPDGADDIREDLESLLGEDAVLYFPDWEILPFDEFSPHEAIVGTRLRTLSRLVDGRRGVVVIPLRAFLRRIIPPADLETAIVPIRLGDVVAPQELISNLIQIGYTRRQVVEDIGTFAMRGGIIDVYPQGLDNPLRVEFFGNEIESIREFDPITQRSVSRIEGFRVRPAREIVLDDSAIERFMGRLTGKRLKGKQIEDVVLHVKDRFFFDGMEAYAPHFYSSEATIASYLPNETLYVLMETDSLEEKSASVMAEAEVLFKEHDGKANGLPEPGSVFGRFGYDPILAGAGRVVQISALKVSGPSHNLDFKSPETFGGSLKVLNSVLNESLEAGYQTFILCDNIGQAERLEEVISHEAGGIEVGVGSLREGFIYPEAHLKVITDHEIFGRYTRKPRYPRFRGEGPIESYKVLSVGDFVVHVNHGIGQYGGVQKITVEGRETECLLVHYQGGDKLYVPIEQLDLLQKYIGKDGQPPALSKLGGAIWERTKARTKRAIKEMAEELIKIYALRRARPGHAFKPDTRWQKELEASFIYDDTPDQLRASEEIKKDMESSRPMDRLVCGDVGYGKTEVAIRAAFKAVMDGKQVAVLVPTTVLAQQHYYTFRERLADYPVIVEMLSRFRTHREQKAIVEGLRQGQVDVVIGTHRLIQKDIGFKDLGLVIIDEEQRFGVAHKEAFKKMRATLDVLTLTATPIPRTLHMALLGARDMSIIDTPPKDRLPVETEVVQFDDEVIVSAALRELDRGGQVFFVHNRIESIATVAAHVSSLLPQAGIRVAHGQMKEKELERVMLDFVEKKFDILVSTMIVESGLDIPNVNTIVVNRADTLGLAQLYQLRGRVGRSRHRAYAYLLVPKRRRLTDEQRKRLKTLTEFTDLGSGFKVAMRDLEIRGAGNILGPQQSGYIAEVGFDLYCKLLEEAVKELKGEAVELRAETRIETDLSALIPNTYVEDDRQRVIFYKRLVGTREIADIEDLELELVDRYGRVPAEAKNLLCFQVIRILASKAGIERVVVKKSGIVLEAGGGKALSIEGIENIVKAGVDIEIQAAERPGIRLREVPSGEAGRFAVTRKVLNALLGL